MSPEANSEQGQDQATKSKFDTSVHPEGVREFGRHGDLAKMARITKDGELETHITIPEHPGVIDPHTRELDKVEKVPPLEEKKSRKGLLIGMGSAAAGVALTAATFMGLSGGDKAEQPRANETISASPTPEQTGPTAAEMERSELEPRVASAAMLSPEWFEPGGEVPANVDDTLLLQNLHTLLENITYMRETGDFSAMELTFMTDDAGNFPGAAADAEGIKQQYEINKQYQEQNADYPVSTLNIGQIESIDVNPDDYKTIKVTAITLERTFGAPSEGAEPTPFESATRTEYTLMAVPHEVSEGVTEEIWVILSQAPLGAVELPQDDLSQDQLIG